MKRTPTLLLKKEANLALSARLSWLTELAQVDPMSGLTLSIKHITALLNDTALTLAEKISLIFAIDEANHAAACEQMVTFVKADQLKAEIAESMVDTNYAYHRIVFLSYVRLIGLSSHKPTELALDTTVQLTLLTRALCSALHMLKWRFFEHASAPANVWAQINALYLYADHHGYTKKIIQPYPEATDTCVNHLFLHLFMLGSLNYNEISKSHLYTIDQLLSHWVAEIRVKHQQESFHVFYIDLTKDHPARRIRQGLIGHRCLYWDLDEIEYAIDHALSLITQQQTPPLLDFVEIKNVQCLSQALAFLKLAWSTADYKRQRRKEMRHDTAKMATITLGLAPIHDLLSQFNQINPASQTVTARAAIDKPSPTRIVMGGGASTLMMGKEKWSIVNESNVGLGSVIQEKTNAETKPNRIVAMLMQHEHKKPVLGVVRNIKQMSAGKLKIGIEILSTDASPATLRTYPIKPDQPETEDEALVNPDAFDALYIPHHIHDARAACIILPSAHYVPHALYLLQVKHKQCVIQLGALLEHGDDWVKLNFLELTNLQSPE